MTNFELHDKAQQLSDTTSAYELARRLIQAEEDRDQLRGCFHNACGELSTLKAALVDEGDEVPVGPALSLVEELKAERDALAASMNKICNMFGIGEAARTSGILLINVENAARFARYLHAIEDKFFMVPVEAGSDRPDKELVTECLVNSWGSTQEQYIKQFRDALARRDAEQQAAAIEKWSTTIIQLFEWAAAKHVEDPSFPPIHLQMIRELCCDMERDADRIRREAKAAS